MYRSLLILILILGPVPAVNADWLYWIDNGSPVNSVVIQRMDLRCQVIETVKSGLHAATSLVVDPCGHKIYWCDNDPAVTGRIFRSNLDGTRTEAIVHGGIANRYLALDSCHGYVYWASVEGVIERCRLDGSCRETLTSAENPFGFALDTCRGKMYWTEPNSDRNVICRANVDGSMTEDLIATGERPGSVAVDQTNGRIYWTEVGQNHRIRRANLDGSNVTDVATQGLSALNDLCVSKGVVYCASGTGVGGKIQRLGAHGVEDVVLGLHQTRSVDYVAQPCIRFQPRLRCRDCRK